MINDKLKELVQRTAVNFDNSVRGDIIIFTLGLTEEIAEAIDAFDNPGVSVVDFKTELADVVWYSIAIDLCLGFSLLDSYNVQIGAKPNNSHKFFSPLDALNAALHAAIKYQGKVKKYVRDYPNRHLLSISEYIVPLIILNDYFDLSDSYDLLEAKLGKRYPEGFDPDRVSTEQR
jgi:hypothetical protein